MRYHETSESRKRRALLPITIVLISILIIAAEAGSSYLTESGRNLTSTSVSTSTQTGGLELSVVTNSSDLHAGHSLHITVSLNNTTPAPLNLTIADDWQVPGFPISIVSSCFTNEPLEFMIVLGNYNLNGLQAASTNSSGDFPVFCMEGGHANYTTFEPNSDMANFTGFFCTTNCRPLTLAYRLLTNFTVRGYWGYPLNGSEDNKILSEPNPPCYVNGVRDCSTFAYPEVGPAAQHRFIDGAYTLVVEDEWGDVVLLHFSVNG